MAERVKVGATYSRWTVVRRAAAVQTSGGMRASCVVRCVCGHEKRLQESYLKRGASTGCPNAECRITFKLWPMFTKRLEEIVRESFAAHHLKSGAEGADAR